MENLLGNIAHRIYDIVEERKNAIEEFMRSSDVNASSNNNGNIDSTVQAFIDSQKNKVSSNARKHYLNK